MQRKTWVLPLVLLAVAGACQKNADEVLKDRAFDVPAWTSTAEFTGVSSLRVLSDGRLVVADLGDEALLLLDSSGSQLSTLGRKGQGPGEYMSPHDVFAMPGDSTRLVDPVLRRTLVFDATPKFVRVDSLPTQIAEHVGNDVVVAANGDIVVEAFPNFAKPAPHVFLLRWSAASGKVDTLASLKGRAFGAGQVQTRGGRPVMMFMLVPYAHHDHWTVSSDSRAVAVRADQNVVEWLDRTDSLRVIRSTPAATIPVPDQERQEAESHLRDLMPKFKPVFVSQSMLAGPAGELWINRTPADSVSRSEWEVTDANTGRASSISFPKGHRVLAVTASAIYTVHADQDDIERVSRFDRR